MARRCRSCLTVAKPRTRKCGACGKALPKKRRAGHMAALDLPRSVFVAANDGFDGCWVCRELGVKLAGPTYRDHEHKGAGTPRGILCRFHNGCLGPRYTPALTLALARYLNRDVAA